MRGNTRVWGESPYCPRTRHP
ncbi:protein of unknown function (plasmid) [Cupriavidus taiwanensis]|nr:protein of unknown function [Cupriavidus taiwanensis]SPC18291.1 hypothetical protein CT19431_MP30266 [Cupriavidus taiwanensis]SPD53879.1 protein of unknown function [Cupriavidus taiwanensis]